MSINFGTRLFASATSLQAGQLIEFGYNGTPRWGVIVAAAWKMNCDCYVFDSVEDVPEELLELIVTQRPLSAGDLYSYFTDQYTFKSFNLEKMGAIQNIEFDTYREGQRSETDDDDFEIEGTLVWGEDTIITEGEG